MTHQDLVDKAVKWLKNFIHCRIVLAELVAHTKTGETPDVIGWVYGRPILIECKTSVADFHADRKKPSRHERMAALGVWRFYLTPPCLFSPKNMARAPGWGFYEVHGRRVVFVGGREYSNAGLAPFSSDKDSEIALLLSALARKNCSY